MQQTIENKLNQAFSPSHLQVINESHMHRSSADGHSHFKAIIVSDHFEGKRLLARHREVNAVLADELATSLHALALHTYTSEEWLKLAQQAPRSPSCTG
ncbi:BolA family transcriptional regulator [Paraferrimonas haliotis]|uniref:BolA family transcriptional regulator n=2 Tax=Paraferrimonas haliotis TaxID=2013866 RepID=A0AA37TNL4_9GAMM|nr:BolA family transcriptional regulator [Paraferrimonas haliotis]